MKLLYLPITLASALLMFAFPTNVHASEMIVSTSSGYSGRTKNFSPTQTIYIKVEANNNGSTKKELNVRTADYSLLSTYQMSQSANNTFTANIPAPQEPDYYSLEAIIESRNSKTTTVKTIKVGNPGSSDINVSVKSESNNRTSQNEETSLEPEDTPEPSPSTHPSPVTNSDIPVREVNNKNIFLKIKDRVASIIDFLKVIF